MELLTNHTDRGEAVCIITNPEAPRIVSIQKVIDGSIFMVIQKIHGDYKQESCTIMSIVINATGSGSINYDEYWFMMIND